MTPIIPVVAAILENKDGQILIVQRPEHQHYGLFWEFPGGKIELAETPQQALSRELKEELDIQVNPEDLLLIHEESTTLPHATISIGFYHCQRWEGIPQPMINQPDMQWVEKKDLPKYPMPESNATLYEVFLGSIHKKGNK